MRSLFVVLALFFFQATFADVALITVTGEAEKSVDPNMVNLQIEIWSRGPQAKMAQENVAKEYQRVKSVVDKFKVKKEDFQTLSYNLSPEYNYDKGQNRIVGHRASQVILITLRKVDEAGTLVDSLSSATKNDAVGVSISSIAWDYDKRNQVQLSLLNEAVKDAKEQADELAKASGSKIKRVYRLSRSADAVVQPMPKGRLLMANEASMASTDLSTGPVKIQVSVSADYELQ